MFCCSVTRARILGNLCLWTINSPSVFFYSPLLAGAAWLELAGVGLFPFSHVEG